jgi:hypothetical protein
VRDDCEVMTRVTVDEISRKRAKGRATALLDYYKSRGGTVAHISTENGECLYKL